MTIKWAVSVLDWRNHAVDERRDHPVGMWETECGHRLTVLTTILHDEPFGALCEQCATQQLASPAEADAKRQRASAGVEQPPTSVTQQVAARWVLTQLLALANQAPGLTDHQLRNRLGVLARQARTRVEQRESQPTMVSTVTASLPVDELINYDSLTSIDTVTWWCRLCATQGKATTTPVARSEATDHLATKHHATT